MKKKETNQFQKWFKKQFGSLPEEHRHVLDIMRDMEVFENKLQTLRNELKDSYSIRDMFHASSYTRNASEKGFNF